MTWEDSYSATARSSRASGPARVGAGSPSPWGFDLRVEGPRDQAQEASGHTGVRVGTHCMLGRQWTPRRTGRSRAKCANGGRAAKGLLYCAENRGRALSKRLFIAEPVRKLALAEVWSLQWGSGLEAECGKGAVMLSVRGDELLN